MALPIISSEKLILRQLRQSDAKVLATLANDKKLAKFIPHLPSPYSPRDAKSWINKTHRLAGKGTEYHFAACDRQGGYLVGMIGLRNINNHDLNAEVGYWIGRRYWNRGYAAQAVRAILGFVFGEMRFRRAYAIVSQNNPASIRVLEKSGFIREAVWRKACRMGNRWYNVLSYGILKEEF